MQQLWPCLPSRLPPHPYLKSPLASGPVHAKHRSLYSRLRARRHPLPEEGGASQGVSGPPLAGLPHLATASPSFCSPQRTPLRPSIGTAPAGEGARFSGISLGAALNGSTQILKPAGRPGAVMGFQSFIKRLPFQESTDDSPIASACTSSNSPSIAQAAFSSA